MIAKKSLVAAAARGVVRYFLHHPRMLIAAVVVYVLLPVDFAPEAFLGPIGLLDDLFVVALPLLLRGYASRLKDEPGAPKPKDYYDTTAR